MQTAAKKDANHNSIKALLERSGIFCHDTHQLKKFCDMVVSLGGITELIEVKNGNGKLTKGEAEFADSWPQEVHIIRDERTAMEFVDMIYAKAGRLQKEHCSSCARYEKSCVMTYKHKVYCRRFKVIAE